jgi:hypothetical protein
MRGYSPRRRYLLLVERQKSIEPLNTRQRYLQHSVACGGKSGAAGLAHYVWKSAVRQRLLQINSDPDPQEGSFKHWYAWSENVAKSIIG